MKNVFKLIIKDQWQAVLFGVLLTILSSLSKVLAGYSLTFLFNTFVEINQQILHQLYRNALVVAGLFALSILVELLADWYLLKLKRAFRIKTRKTLVDNLLKTHLNEFQNKENGQYLSWLTNDIDAIDEKAISSFFEMIQHLFTMIFSLAALFLLHYTIGFSAIFLLILLSVVPSKFASLITKENTNISNNKELFSKYLKDYISGFSVFHYAKRMNNLNEQLDKQSKHYEETLYTSNRNILLVNQLTFTLSIIAQFGIIFIAIFATILANAPKGAAFSVSNLGGNFFSSAASLINSLLMFQGAQGILEKLPLLTESKENNLSSIQEEIIDISLNQLSYRYSDLSQPITYPNIYLENGKNYAIVGKSSSGKTTLAKILSGNTYLSTGDIIVNGQQIPLDDFKKYSDQFTYIDQQLYFFNASLRKNIRLWQSSVSDEEIWNLLKLVDLDQFVEQLPDKLDTLLSNTALNFSGGQRQKVALARGLVNGSKFIIIDESTSQLDSHSAKIIENNLIQSEQFSIIVISHHLSSDKNEKFDQIIDLDTY